MDGWAGIQGKDAMSSATLNGSLGQQFEDFTHNFSVHLQHDNISALQLHSIEVEFIPAGYAPFLQAMDKVKGT